MSDCTDCTVTRECGTGIVRPPLPGDPNNIASISAVGTFGGIEVSVTYPSVNAFAVSFVRLYRGRTPDFTAASEHAIMNGSVFYDRIDGAPQTFYYWVRFVSVQGTEQDPIGPASATSQDRSQDYLESLHESIHEGLLATTLRSQIDRIQLNKLGIDAETLARAASDNSLAASISETRAVAEDTQALIQQEVLARAGADEALVNTVNTLAVKVDKDIQAAIQQEQKVRADQYAALASQITTAQSKLGDDIASVQVSMNTEVSRITKDLVTLGSLYTVQVQANGLVGGFGIYNDGRTVEAGFDVNRFWIGRGSNKYKPFIINRGNIYFNGTVEFSNLNGAGALAGKDNLGYNEIVGTKPPSNADHTGSNTSRDTARVAGETASSVRDKANAGSSAASRVNTWTRPNTTRINGNQIWTGDAYVDTLEIHGNAVTIPAANVASGQISPGNGEYVQSNVIWGYNSRNSPAFVTATFAFEASDSRSHSTLSVTSISSASARLLRNGSVIHTWSSIMENRQWTPGGGSDGGPYQASTRVNGYVTVSQPFPNGLSGDIELQVQINGNGIRRFFQRSLFIQGIRR